eukprot:4301859-Amphidinium_carterae.1
MFPGWTGGVLVCLQAVCPWCWLEAAKPAVHHGAQPVSSARHLRMRCMSSYLFDTQNATKPESLASVVSDESLPQQVQHQKPQLLERRATVLLNDMVRFRMPVPYEFVIDSGK